MEASELKSMLDTLWVLVAGFLVFFMNAGFALVESGLCRAKNTVNILAKNFMAFSLAVIGFWSVGYALMFGQGGAFNGSRYVSIPTSSDLLRSWCRRMVVNFAYAK